MASVYTGGGEGRGRGEGELAFTQQREGMASGRGRRRGGTLEAEDAGADGRGPGQSLAMALLIMSGGLRGQRARRPRPGDGRGRLEHRRVHAGASYTDAVSERFNKVYSAALSPPACSSSGLQRMSFPAVLLRPDELQLRPDQRLAARYAEFVVAGGEVIEHDARAAEVGLLHSLCFAGCVLDHADRAPRQRDER